MRLISFAKNGSNQRSIVSVYDPYLFKSGFTSYVVRLDEIFCNETKIEPSEK